jgi:hypothetical protein
MSSNKYKELVGIVDQTSNGGLFTCSGELPPGKKSILAVYSLLRYLPVAAVGAAEWARKSALDS